MQNFQDTFETSKQLFISAFSICTTVLLNKQPCLLANSFPIFFYLGNSEIHDSPEVVYKFFVSDTHHFLAFHLVPNSLPRKAFSLMVILIVVILPFIIADNLKGELLL